jgi:hypothetical protein
MRVIRIPASSGTSERRCHCGARFNGSDHCPQCGCEQYERYCDALYLAPEDRLIPATESWVPGQRHAGYDPREL